MKRLIFDYRQRIVGAPMKRRILALIFAATVTVSAQSQQPTQNQSSHQAQPAKPPDQIQQPGSSVVITQGDVAQGRTEQQNSDARGVEPKRAWFQDPNWWIVLITAILAVVSVWQMILTRKSVNSSRRAANAARKSAVIAHNALIVANPPKIIVREVQSPFADQLHMVVDSTPPRENPHNALMAAFTFSPLKNETAITATIRVMNKGKSNATIVGSDCRWLIRDGLPHLNPIDDSKSVLEIAPLTPGASIRVPVPDLLVDAGSMASLVLQRQKLYLIGVIVYADDLGNQRRSGFRRIFEPGSGRFEGPEDKDWEYVD